MFVALHLLVYTYTSDMNHCCNQPVAYASATVEEKKVAALSIPRVVKKARWFWSLGESAVQSKYRLV